MKILNRDKGPWAFAQVVKGWWGLVAGYLLGQNLIWKKKEGGK